MTKQALADRFGVQRPSLSRELIKMKNENIINFDRKPDNPAKIFPSQVPII